MTDLVTQLQDQVDHICNLYCNTTSALVQQAPPARVGDEPPPPVPEGAIQDVEKATGEMARAVVGAAQRLDELAAHLPPPDTEEASLQRLEKLQAESDAVGQELEKELDAAEADLARVRQLFIAAADYVLLDKSGERKAALEKEREEERAKARAEFEAEACKP